MKLGLTDLAAHLQKKGLSPYYVIHGDDPYLQQQAQTTLSKTVDAATEILRFSASHAQVWDEIAARLQHRSLFAAKQLVFIEVPSIKLAAAAQAHVKQWTATANPDVSLVFSTAKLNAKDKQTAWLKALFVVAHEVELTPPNAQRMPLWLKQALAQKNISTDTAGLNLLAHYFADNPGAALQEIEKLADYLGVVQTPPSPEQTPKATESMTAKISGEELERILVSQGQFTVFQLIDSCLGGKQRQTQQMFEAICTDESLMILITWMLTKELRLLVELSLAMTNGETLANLAKQHRLWPAKVALYQPLLKCYTTSQVWALLSRLAIIDKANKGLGTLSARSQLLHLLQMIASRQFLL